MARTTPTSSTAGLDPAQVGKHLDRALEGADDGELFLEYRQSEALMFDNGRLKQATYDTSQGFGLRAVKDEAVGYAHASDMSEQAIARAADTVRAVKGGYSGSYAEAPGRSNVKLYSETILAGQAEAKVKLRGHRRRGAPKIHVAGVGKPWRDGQMVEIPAPTGRSIATCVRWCRSCVGSRRRRQAGIRQFHYGGREAMRAIDASMWQSAVDEAVRRALSISIRPPRGDGCGARPRLAWGDAA